MTLPEPYYEQDGIRIFHARCEDILPHVDPADVALVLTDPPYGVNHRTEYKRAGRGRAEGRHAWAARDHPRVHGDNERFDPTPLLRFDCGHLVLWGANNYADKLPTTRTWLVWDRQSDSDDSTDAELAWTSERGPIRIFRHMWTGYRRDSEIGFHVHPTQKPVALMRWILDRWTKPGDLVLDPYMGSGPVARAAMDLGRRYVGVECVEEYCAVAVRRLAQGVLPLEAS